MPPALDDEIERAVDLGAHVVALDRQRRERGRHIEHGERLRRALDRLGGGGHLRGKPLENLQLHRERAIRGAGDLGLQRGELGGGEAHLPGQRLAMDEGRIQRRREQLLAVLRGDLDEIAQHVVVAHLERADAGLVRVARLQRRHHAARFIAQRARLVERAVVAGAHEAAVALQIRQVIGKRRGERRDDRIVRRRERTRRFGDLVRRFQRGEPPREFLRCDKPVADRRKIARAAALEHQPRQRAREVRRRREL